MSRLVLIEFEDKDSAQSFVMNSHMPEQLGYEVKGMWFLPRKKICECPGRANVKNWSRANRFSVPVCVKCGKPSNFWAKGLMTRLQIALGINLIEE